ncbi:MAG TPA: AfsR/SARP family transcriptional regulator [Acidimicrobiales bacterium]
MLGPLEVLVDGRPVEPGGARARAVLAGLALEADRVVPLATLVRLVWGDRPPATARKQVQNLVSGLRRRLVAAGAGGDVIATHPAGYRLQVPAGAVDLARFEDCVAAARAARQHGRWADAAAALDRGLALWRGDPLADLTCPGLDAAIARIADLRPAALEDWTTAELALGHHREILPALTAAVADHPYRERLRCHLMVALYRSGRQAEALACYREARTLLVEELGIEPGAELQQVERAILSNDSGLDPPAGPGPGPDALAPPAPRRRADVPPSTHPAAAHVDPDLRAAAIALLSRILGLGTEHAAALLDGLVAAHHAPVRPVPADRTTPPDLVAVVA